jgi:hypothetical protein
MDSTPPDGCVVRDSKWPAASINKKTEDALTGFLAGEALLAYNLLTALKRLALPAEYLTARPKRLRFLIFNTPGRLVHRARSMMLRLATTAERLARWLGAFNLLPLRA